MSHLRRDGQWSSAVSLAVDRAGISPVDNEWLVGKRLRALIRTFSFLALPYQPGYHAAF